HKLAQVQASAEQPMRTIWCGLFGVGLLMSVGGLVFLALQNRDDQGPHGEPDPITVAVKGGRSGRPAEAVALLSPFLNDPDPDARLRAAAAILEFDDEHAAALAVLNELLKQDDQWEARWAALHVAHRGPRARGTVGAIMRLLKSPDADTR